MSFNATVPLTRMDEKLCQRILQVNTEPSHPSVLWGMSYMKQVAVCHSILSAGAQVRQLVQMHFGAQMVVARRCRTPGMAGCI